MKKTEARKNITPDEYKKILSNVDLVSLRVISCSSKVRPEKLAQEMRISVKDKISFEIIDEKLAVFTHQYDLTSRKDGVSQKDYAIKISCIFDARFSSVVPFSDDFLAIFSEINIHLNTWPYFREFAQNMSQRMAIPPITLPLLKR